MPIWRWPTANEAGLAVSPIGNKQKVTTRRRCRRTGRDHTLRASRHRGACFALNILINNAGVALRCQFGVDLLLQCFRPAAYWSVMARRIERMAKTAK